jgi:hypothetical protein
MAKKKTWGGMTIPDGASYTCQSQDEANRFANDDNFIISLANGDSEVYNDSTKINGQSASWLFLLDDLRDSDGARLVRARAFSNSDGFRFRGASFSGEVDYGETKNIDFLISAERYINGGRLLVNNIGPNDKITFQVVDNDNVMGFGVGVVLDEFIKDYFIPETGNLEVRLDYPAKIFAGLYLRLKYTSTHADGCLVKCNLYLHWKAV